MKCLPRQNSHRRIVSIALLTVLVTPLAAMHPNHPLGYKPEAVYESGQIDNIDAMSGTLSVTLPLGPFLFTYNSNVWTYQTIIEGSNVYTEATPDRKRTGGIGWHLGIGEVYSDTHAYNPTGKWLYVDQFGGRHSFHHRFDKIHEDNDGQVHYTRDGSYLRLTKVSGAVVEIESPDGITRRFVGTSGGNSTYQLTKVWNPYGSVSDPDLTYAYTDPDPNDDETTLTVTDRYGRSHVLTYYTGYSWNGNPGVVTKVDIESFNGQRMIYTLDYWDKHLDRSCKDDYPNNSTRMKAPHLKWINLPEGTKYDMTYAGQPAYDNTCNGVSDRPGFLNRLTLPTGGAYAWTNQEYEFNGTAPWSTSAGVATRQMIDSSGTVLGTWNYKQTFYPKSGGDEAETATWIQQPAPSGTGQGDCTKHYFFQDDTKSWEQGLPYTKREDQVDGKYLSSELWSGSNTSNGQCSGTKLRSTYLNFRKDVLPSSAEDDQSLWTATNRRVADSRVIYHDDGDRYIDVDSSDDDGLGHWRTVTTSHNFHEDDTIVASHTQTVRYNAYGTYSYWNANWDPPMPEDRWLLGTYEWINNKNLDATGETVTRRYFDFDPDTGFLNCVRQTRTGNAMGASDVVTVFVEDEDTGDVLEVKTYGGDLQSLGTGSVCDTPDLPSDPEAWVKHTYENGARKTSRPFKPNGTQDGSPSSYKTYDVELDASTGLVTKSTNPNGFETDFEYDSMGRPTKTILPSDAYVDYVYTAPSGGNPAEVLTKKMWAGGGGALDENSTQFDDFGRPWKQRHLDAGGWSEAETLYNARGWVTSTSNMGNTSQKTEYLNYDAFGRAGIIRPPQGSADDVTFLYTGDRTVLQEATTYTIDSSFTTTGRTTLRDGFGRIVRVKENSGAGGAEVTTDYEYDVNGNLTKVVQGPEGTTYQTRTFTYNNLGNLLDETHPELGATVNYGSYDTRGNPSSRNDTRVFVKYEYDWRGRLTKVKDANNGDRIVTNSIYDDSTVAYRGKPYQQIRKNWLDLPWDSQGERAISVTEEYTYRVSDGLVSDVTTTVDADLDSQSTGETQTFSLGLNPNTWGLTDKVDYPSCTHTACSGLATGQQVDTDWSKGRIIRVNNWVGDLTYHPSGTWATIPHANGTQDDHIVKTNNNSLTDSLHTTNPGVLWNTGRYEYDGWGNIFRMGDIGSDHDWFRYDEANRLVRASVKEDPSGQRTQQDYTYDAFGNITEVKTWPPGQNSQTMTIQVNANTNRLSSAGYDASGNMNSWGGSSYTYDTANQMVKQDGRWYFLYTFGGERIATIDWQGSIATREVDWTIRGPSNQVLSTFKLTGEDQSGNWSREIDYIWMGRRLLGTEDGSGTQQHYHTDHLGSIRLITDSAGNKVSEHEYLPYGQELTAAGNGVMKFTGHERDGDTGMDYMHARFYQEHLGRFMSVDPILGGGGVLNRYSYVGGRPMNLTDPTGQAMATFRDTITVTGSAWRYYWWFFNGGAGGAAANDPRRRGDGPPNVAPRFWMDWLKSGSGASDGDTEDTDEPFPDPMPDLPLPTVEEIVDALEDLITDLVNDSKDFYCSFGVGLFLGAAVGDDIFGIPLPFDAFSNSYSVTTRGVSSYEIDSGTGSGVDTTLAFGVESGSASSPAEARQAGIPYVTGSQLVGGGTTNSMFAIDLGPGAHYVEGTATTNYHWGPCK